MELGASNKPWGGKGLSQSSPRWPSSSLCCDPNGSIQKFGERSSRSQTFENLSSRSHFMNHPRRRGRSCRPAPETTTRAGSVVSHYAPGFSVPLGGKRTGHCKRLSENLIINHSAKSVALFLAEFWALCPWSGGSVAGRLVAVWSDSQWELAEHIIISWVKLSPGM